mmetsp:Transcript_12965/g.24614  ORF Transcript_12965/g.24614 Transcript_12965/m.24614 type:complete len:294 (+) Transcript_12965:51-932(+)
MKRHVVVNRKIQPFFLKRSRRHGLKFLLLTHLHHGHGLGHIFVFPMFLDGSLKLGHANPQRFQGGFTRRIGPLGKVQVQRIGDRGLLQILAGFSVFVYQTPHGFRNAIKIFFRRFNRFLRRERLFRRGQLFVGRLPLAPTRHGLSGGGFPKLLKAINGALDLRVFFFVFQKFPCSFFQTFVIHVVFVQHHLLTSRQSSFEFLFEQGLELRFRNLLSRHLNLLDLLHELRKDSLQFHKQTIENFGHFFRCDEIFVGVVHIINVYQIARRGRGPVRSFLCESHVQTGGYQERSCN